MSKTVLLTGAAGFIGSHTADRLLADGHTVIGVDNFCDYYNTDFKEYNVAHLADNDRFTLFHKDITDKDEMDAIFSNHEIDTVIHLAAQAGVRVSFEDPVGANKVNVIGTSIIFELAHLHDVQEVIYASSSSVYGNNKKVPFSEDDPVDNPVSVYAATKKANELLAYTYHDAYGMDMVGLRFFTVYGERGRPDMSPYLFAEMISNDKPLRRYGDGSMERDFTYVQDIVSGIVACMGKKLGYEIINLGNSQSISLNEYIATFEKLLNKKAKIEEHPVPAGDVEKTFANTTKARKLLGWEPTTNLEEGLTKFIAWFKENRQANPY